MRRCRSTSFACLLEKGANPNLQLKLLPPYRATGADRGLDQMLTVGTTPLLRAAKAQDAAAIKLLLEHGAIVDLPNSQGMTPTVAASGMGSVDADTRGYYTTADIQDRSIASLDLLLAHGGELNGRAGRLQQAPLRRSRVLGLEQGGRISLGQGRRHQPADSRGFTAVDYAMGRAGGNSRGGQRIDVHKDTGRSADCQRRNGGDSSAAEATCTRVGGPLISHPAFRGLTFSTHAYKVLDVRA